MDDQVEYLKSLIRVVLIAAVALGFTFFLLGRFGRQPLVHTLMLQATPPGVGFEQFAAQPITPCRSAFVSFMVACR